METDSNLRKTNKLACTRCRSKRQKCDRKLGGCTRCKSTIFKCCYPERKKRRRKHEFYDSDFDSNSPCPGKLNTIRPAINSRIDSYLAIKAPILHSNASNSPQMSQLAYSPLLSPSYSNSTDHVPLQNTNAFISDEVFLKHLTTIYITQIYPQHPIFTFDDFTQERRFWGFTNSIYLVGYYSHYGSQSNAISGSMKSIYRWTHRQLLQLAPSINSLKTLANLSLIHIFLNDKNGFLRELSLLNRVSDQLGLSKNSERLNNDNNSRRSLIYEQIKKLNNLI